MAGIFEQAGYDAMASISRVTAPEKPAARYEDKMNRTNYTPNDNRYEGREDIADVVRKQADTKSTPEIYQNPVKDLAQDKSIYASLLNYEFLS